MKIRSARSDDLDCLVELLRQLTEVEADFPFDAPRQQEGLRRLLATPGALIAVATGDDDAVIGMATMQELVSTVEGGPVGAVEDVVVHRNHRGQCIGTALLDFLAQEGLRRGYGRLQLLADQTNHAGEAFYAARGWGVTQLRQWRHYPASHD